MIVNLWNQAVILVYDDGGVQKIDDIVDIHQIKPICFNFHSIDLIW